MTTLAMIKLCHPTISEVQTSYTRCDDGSDIMLFKPGMMFYVSMPKDAKCIFSLTHGRMSPRAAPPHPRAPRFAGLWPTTAVNRIAENLRQLFPTLAASVMRPFRFEDLWDYFDSYDLWCAGAWNLWRVVQRLGAENDAQTGFTHEIDEWVFRWLTWEDNRTRLCHWTPEHDIMTVLRDEDLENQQIIMLGPRNWDQLRRALFHYHRTHFPGPAGYHSSFTGDYFPPRVLEEFEVVSCWLGKLTLFPVPPRPIPCCLIAENILQDFCHLFNHHNASVVRSLLKRYADNLEPLHNARFAFHHYASTVDTLVDTNVNVNVGPNYLRTTGEECDTKPTFMTPVARSTAVVVGCKSSPPSVAEDVVNAVSVQAALTVPAEPSTEEKQQPVFRASTPSSTREFLNDTTQEDAATQSTFESSSGQPMLPSQNVNTPSSPLQGYIAETKTNSRTEEIYPSFSSVSSADEWKDMNTGKHTAVPSPVPELPTLLGGIPVSLLPSAMTGQPLVPATYYLPPHAILQHPFHPMPEIAAAQYRAASTSLTHGRTQLLSSTVQPQASTAVRIKHQPFQPVMMQPVLPPASQLQDTGSKPSVSTPQSRTSYAYSAQDARNMPLNSSPRHQSQTSFRHDSLSSTSAQFGKLGQNVKSGNGNGHANGYNSRGYNYSHDNKNRSWQNRARNDTESHLWKNNKNGSIDVMQPRHDDVSPAFNHKNSMRSSPEHSPKKKCANFHPMRKNMSKAPPYVDCDCDWCSRRNRTVFVSGLRFTDKMGEEELMNELKCRLKQFGTIESCELRHKENWRVGSLHAFARFSTEEEACRAVRGLDGVLIPCLGPKTITVNFQINSKHSTPRYLDQNPHSADKEKPSTVQATPRTTLRETADHVMGNVQPTVTEHTTHQHRTPSPVDMSDMNNNGRLVGFPPSVAPPAFPGGYYSLHGMPQATHISLLSPGIPLPGLPFYVGPPQFFTPGFPPDHPHFLTQPQQVVAPAGMIYMPTQGDTPATFASSSYIDRPLFVHEDTHRHSLVRYGNQYESIPMMVIPQQDLQQVPPEMMAHQPFSQAPEAMLWSGHDREDADTGGFSHQNLYELPSEGQPLPRVRFPGQQENVELPKCGTTPDGEQCEEQGQATEPAPKPWAHTSQVASPSEQYEATVIRRPPPKSARLPSAWTRQEPLTSQHEDMIDGPDLDAQAAQYGQQHVRAETYGSRSGALSRPRRPSQADDGSLRKKLGPKPQGKKSHAGPPVASGAQTLVVTEEQEAETAFPTKAATVNKLCQQPVTSFVDEENRPKQKKRNRPRKNHKKQQSSGQTTMVSTTRAASPAPQQNKLADPGAEEGGHAEGGKQSVPCKQNQTLPMRYKPKDKKPFYLTGNDPHRAKSPNTIPSHAPKHDKTPSGHSDTSPALAMHGAQASSPAKKTGNQTSRVPDLSLPAENIPSEVSSPFKEQTNEIDTYLVGLGSAEKKTTSPPTYNRNGTLPRGFDPFPRMTDTVRHGSLPKLVISPDSNSNNRAATRNVATKAQNGLPTPITASTSSGVFPALAVHQSQNRHEQHTRAASSATEFFSAHSQVSSRAPTPSEEALTAGQTTSPPPQQEKEMGMSTPRIKNHDKRKKKGGKSMVGSPCKEGASLLNPQAPEFFSPGASPSRSRAGSGSWEESTTSAKV